MEYFRGRSPPARGHCLYACRHSRRNSPKPGEDAITSLKQGKSPSYRDSGVDIDAGDALVEAIKPLAKATARPGTAAGLGGFGALFDLKAAGFKDPILVATTDGVGTKLKLAIATARHDTIGIDLVAMCVNDLVVQGAQPLLFLDYYASGKLELETGTAILRGIAQGCREAGCALIGGETAEMPGLYASGDYDLAGFAVGAVERGRELSAENVTAGDAILGLRSSGLHSNGFSLVRKVVADLELDLAAPAPFAADVPLGVALLEPTRIYVKSALAAIAAGGVKVLAHITGGGLIENLPRVLPDGLLAEVDAARWSAPPVFRWLAEDGGVAGSEMLRTFNCGIGMVAVVAADRAAPLSRLLQESGERVVEIGRILRNGAGAPSAVRIVNADALWRG